MKKFMGIFIKFLLWFIIISFLGVFLIPYIPYKTYDTAELITEDSRFIEIDGVKIHYVKYFNKENENKPSLLFLHGVGGSLFTFEAIMNNLKNDYNIYAFDFVGFGLSRKLKDFDYTLQNQIEILKKYIESMKIKDLVIIGHSMGGGAALLYHHLHKENLKGLVLISPVSDFQHSGKIAYPFSKFISYLTINVFSVKRIVENSFFDKSKLTDLMYKRYIYPVKEKGTLDAFQRMLENPIIPEGLFEYAKNVEIPVIIIWGRNDIFVPLVAGEEYNRIIKNSVLYIIDKAGHSVEEEKPDEITNYIRNFLKGITSESTKN